MRPSRWPTVCSREVTDMSAIDLSAEPYDEARIDEIVSQFHRDGYYFFGPVLNDDEVAATFELITTGIFYLP